VRDRRLRNRRRSDWTPAEREAEQARLVTLWLERKFQIFTCAWCGVVKPLAEFHDQTYHRQCKACWKRQHEAASRRKALR
jgi:hypothetical protein